MNTPATTPRAARTRRAFTLLEVLMATFVVALGSLGLLALFAGAAGQQQRSARLTTSVTLSKNAEALIKSNFENFGTAAELGALVPQFEDDAWYCLPADARYGYLTINPTNDPDEDTLYIEADPRAGLSPRAIYRAAADLNNEVLFGVGRLDGVLLAPFSIGEPELQLDLGDRRLLPNTIEVEVRYRQIAQAPSGRIELDLVNDPDPLEYTFRGTPNDARNNIIFLGQTNPPPDSINEDHFRINTETFPVDGTRNARIVSFQVDDVLETRNTDVVNVVYNPDIADWIAVVPFWDIDSLFNVFPGLTPAELAVLEQHPVSWIDPTGATGRPVYTVADPADADVITIRDPRTSPTSATRLAGVPMVDGLNDTNNQSVVFQPGGALPLEHIEEQGSVFNGEFAIERAAPAGFSGNAYSLNDDGGTRPLAGTLRQLEYPSRMIDSVTIDYKRRSDELISLGNRISYVRDPNFRGQRRPEMAYSVLYRDRSGRASDQFVVFTYTLTPQSSTAEWFPPETAEEIEDGEAPLRRIKAGDLVYQRDNERYVLFIDADTDRWAASPGQILMFAGASRTNDAAGPGADTPVRVVDVVEQNNGRFALVLDRAPRAGGQTLLELFYPGDVSGPFDVWGVNSDVESVVDGSDWILRPVEARVFQAGDQ